MKKERIENMITNAPLKAGGREWAGLVVLALPTLLLSIDVSVLYLALPKMSAALGATSCKSFCFVGENWTIKRVSV
jgi:hypothetical protein